MDVEPDGGGVETPLPRVPELARQVAKRFEWFQMVEHHHSPVQDAGRRHGRHARRRRHMHAADFQVLRKKKSCTF
jgi:hypothetical protein